MRTFHFEKTLLSLVKFPALLAVLAGCTESGTSDSSSSSSAQSLSSINSIVSYGDIGAPIANVAPSNGLPVICDSMSMSLPQTYGFQGQLLAFSNTAIESADQAVSQGTAVAAMHLSSLDIPTIRLSRGFMTTGEQIIRDQDGQVLTNNFAISLNGQLTLTDSDAEGLYQLGVISADGSKIDLKIGGVTKTYVDNDGAHFSKMGCATDIINLKRGDKVPVAVRYFHKTDPNVTLTFLWRKVETTDSDSNQDPLCGVEGDTLFWDPSTIPSTPSLSYNRLLQRQWQPVNAHNILLPNDVAHICFQKLPNPQPSPVVSPSPSASPSPEPSPSASAPTPEPSPSTVIPDPQPSPSTIVPEPQPSPSVDNPGPRPSPQPSPSQPTPQPSPSSPVICDPNSAPVSAEYGLRGELYTATANESQNVDQMIQRGTKLSSDLYLNDLAIPTTAFDRGFTSVDGHTLKDLQGQTLIEYFALNLHSQLALSETDSEGEYQLAVLADDGAILSVTDLNGQTVTVNNDGLHQTQMQCAGSTVTMRRGRPLPMKLKWYQGPRMHIALTMLWRKVSSSSSSALKEEACGAAGNDLFWDSSKVPSVQTDYYQRILSRGWKVLGKKNFLLKPPEQNPCAPQNPGPFTCRQYIEITPDTSKYDNGLTCGGPYDVHRPWSKHSAYADFSVPKRADGVCYYVKMIDKTNYLNSYQFRYMRNDIMARNHDGRSPHPWVMGMNDVVFRMEGDREVVLGSNKYGNAPMFFDNFLLVETRLSTSPANDKWDLQGYGTADSLPSNGRPITVLGKPVNFTPLAGSGMATVQPISLPQLNPSVTGKNATVVLRTTALDCGVIGQTSDVYLVFK